MKLKKLLTVLLVVLLTLSLVLVAACNNNDSPDPENPDNTNPGGTTPGGSTSGGTTTQKAEHPSDHTYEPVWEHGKYDHWQACGHEGCTYIDIDSYNYHEYVDGVCKDCGEPDDPNDDYPFTDMPEVPDPPIGGGGGGTTGEGYHVVGKIEGKEDWTDGILFSQDADRADHYYIELNLKAGDQFKVKHPGIDNWGDGEWGFNEIYMDPEGVVTTKGDLFYGGGQYGTDICVRQDCHVWLNRYEDSGTLNIYVKEVSGEITPTPAGSYLFVHDPSSWDDSTGTPMVLNEATGNYELKNITMTAGQGWKIKQHGVDWDTWSIKASDTINEKFSDSVTKRPSGKVFAGGDNIELNYDCTFDLELIVSSKTVNVTITAITIPEHDVTYTYTFHVYAPSLAASGLQIHVWGAISPTNWSNGQLTAESGHQGWYSYTYSSKTAKSGSLSVIIHNGDNKYAVFNDGAGTGPAVSLAENMYFVYNINTQAYTSYEAAQAAASFTVSNVVPVQVATVPPQSAVKFKFAA